MNNDEIQIEALKKENFGLQCDIDEIFSTLHHPEMFKINVVGTGRVDYINHVICCIPVERLLNWEITYLRGIIDANNRQILQILLS